jgi:exodeoxyribonuclease V gamma subunit
MFRRLDGEGKVGAEEVFSRKDLIAAANRVQLGWLKLEAMYRAPERRTWALRSTGTVDEITEGIVREGPGGRWREAAQWPLFRLLHRFEGAPGAYLERLGGGERGGDVRRWRLAGRLARLYEDYQNYRPGMVGDWSRGGTRGTDKATAWEAELWRELRREMGEDTLWDAYRDLPARVAAAAEREGWRRVEVFGASMLSPVQMAVFRELGKHLETTLSLFNPAKGDWFELPRAALWEAGGGESAVRERPEEREWGAEERRHPLLSRNGTGARDTVAGALDLADGDVPTDEEGAWLEGVESDLGRLQREIGEGTDPGAENGARGDGSIRILRTHGKMREAEVVREEILRAFDELPGLEPMDVQVQVAGLDAYAPYLEAVFGGGELPFAIETGTGTGEETVQAFVQWMEAAAGRFAATEVLSLLRAGPVRRKLGLDEEGLQTAERLVKASGIRWGADAAHHGEECGRAFPECSWRYGLERLLLGYAMGEESESGGMRGCDLAEGGDAVTAGRVGAFARRLAEFREASKASKTCAGWRVLLSREFERNLDAGMDGRGADRVRKALDRLETLAADSGCAEEKVSFEVVKEQLLAQLGEARVGANLERNAVQINELRVGSSTPRRVQVVMGLESGQFPGGETRAAYDLLRTGEGRKGRMGDRNPMRESRAAFLECLMSAGERLALAHSAWTETDLASKAEAGALKELRDWLARGGAPGARIVEHKLHGYSPEYFRRGGELVSHSAGDREAAAILEKRRRGGETAAAEAPAKPEADWPASVDVEDLVRYFRNPAKAHWESLGVYWRAGDAGMEDSEAFELDGLQNFGLKEAGLEALRAVGETATEEERSAAVVAAVDAAYERMKEAGEAPLGGAKAACVTPEAEAVSGLPRAWQRNNEPLMKALWTERRPVNAETVVVADGHEVRVTGRLEAGADGVQPKVRCASPKERVRMEMWVKHLLGVAAGAVKRTCLVQLGGGSAKQGDDWGPEGLDAAAAKRELAEWVKAYAEWRRGAAPFHPAASAAFAASGDAEKAREAWREDADGGDDVCQVREFGAEGPVDRAEFGDLAMRLMGPIPKPVLGKGAGKGKKGGA